MVRTGAWNLEHHPGLSVRSREPSLEPSERTWTISHCFSGSINGKLDWKRITGDLNWYPYRMPVFVMSNDLEKEYY